ncbi:MAG: Hpt domain-containing protein, partial [Pseudomonadota bacterium]|nr:Hpt domain-containing protein [Pseudomonadota bacterium]
NSVFRAAHSIKGGSAIFGFTAMTGLTHVMENMLDRARNEELSLTNELITVLLETVDVLKDILHSYRNDEEIDWDVVETNKAILEKELDLAMSGQAGNGQAEDSDVQQVESGAEEASEADEGFGFFDQPDDNNDEDGFGFFDEDISVSASSHSDEDDQGFGFFDETLDSSSDDSNDGFGFFDDAPAAPTQEKKADDDEIEGFGFFESESDDVKDGDVVLKDSDSSAATNPSDAGDKGDGFGFFDESMKARHEQDKIDDKQGYGLYPKEKDEPASKTTPRKTKAKPASKPAEAKSSEATSIRVETVKIDKLVNLVGELVITQSMLNLIGNEVQESVAEKMMGALAELERNTREIQEAVMSVRMLPIS